MVERRKSRDSVASRTSLNLSYLIRPFILSVTLVAFSFSLCSMA